MLLKFVGNEGKTVVTQRKDKDVSSVKSKEQVRHEFPDGKKSNLHNLPISERKWSILQSKIIS